MLQRSRDPLSRGSYANVQRERIIANGRPVASQFHQLLLCEHKYRLPSLHAANVLTGCASHLQAIHCFTHCTHAASNGQAESRHAQPPVIRKPAYCAPLMNDKDQYRCYNWMSLNHMDQLTPEAGHSITSCTADVTHAMMSEVRAGNAPANQGQWLSLKSALLRHSAPAC